jgi:hypothetical protein
MLGYRIIEHGTKRQKDMLVDANDYKYQVDKRRNTTVYWRCCSRHTDSCPATVIQSGNSFRPGRQAHIEPPIPGIFEAITVRRNVKKLCVDDVFQSAFEVAEDELHNMLTSQYEGPRDAFSNLHNLARYGNRARQALPNRLSPKRLSPNRLVAETSAYPVECCLYRTANDGRKGMWLARRTRTGEVTVRDLTWAYH